MDYNINNSFATDFPVDELKYGFEVSRKNITISILEYKLIENSKIYESSDVNNKINLVDVQFV